MIFPVPARVSSETLLVHRKVLAREFQQDLLSSAEKLINDCGYHRRDEELADAKRAILHT